MLRTPHGVVFIIEIMFFDEPVSSRYTSAQPFATAMVEERPSHPVNATKRYIVYYGVILGVYYGYCIAIHPCLRYPCLFPSVGKAPRLTY